MNKIKAREIIMRLTREANKAFNHSCDCCCNRGMKIDCDKCSIAFVHSLVVACFDGNGKTA